MSVDGEWAREVSSRLRRLELAVAIILATQLPGALAYLV